MMRAQAPKRQSTRAAAQTASQRMAKQRQQVTDSSDDGGITDPEDEEDEEASQQQASGSRTSGGRAGRQAPGLGELSSKLVQLKVGGGWGHRPASQLAALVAEQTRCWCPAAGGAFPVAVKTWCCIGGRGVNEAPASMRPPGQ
jgi:hypothetical protein